MFRTILTFARHLMTVLETVEKNKEEIRELRSEFGELVIAVEGLKHDFQRLRESEKLEREKHYLALENALLKFERRLPAPKSGKDTR
ncbi:MAG: hypothetical protein HY043_16820 [Verrucomicrobia bacterium]|nr:hypothetical protein [Verrucomicrobiota bacterium]